MATKVIDISKYSISSSDVYFFDNNIWMLIFGPVAGFNKDRQKLYSSFLSTAKSAGCCIFINSLILSEFSNRSLRIEFDIWKRKSGIVNPNFKKDYVGTVHYKETVDELKIIINNILKICQKTGDNFNAINLNNVLTHFETIDFNDSYYIELCTLLKCKLVTDDQDFTKYSNHNLEVITIPNK